MKNENNSPLVSIIMGSESDLPVMKEAADILKDFGVPFDIRVCSAHRAPDETAEFAKTAQQRGVRVIIAGAGGAAHLPGVIAAHTILPVIGVPCPNGPLAGEDALLAIVQMPKGIPVATVAIGGAANAGILAVQILASGGAEPNGNLQEKVRTYKDEMRKKILAKKVQV
jgi:5-(carboxyamino)imidazole ribonucleotide mutase